jgi:hypothetical protein
MAMFDQIMRPIYFIPCVYVSILMPLTVPSEEGSPLGIFFPLLEARTTSQLPLTHLPLSRKFSELAEPVPLKSLRKRRRHLHWTCVGPQEDSRGPNLAGLAPHEDEFQPDLAMIISEYAHLIKEHPKIFLPPLEVLPQPQPVVALALTEAKQSDTTEKGDRWCHTPDPLNIIIEVGWRGRIPMGVDCTPSISKAGLYLLVPMFGP